MSMEEMKNNVEQLSKLTANLEAARSELESINEEETLLEWEESAFPLLQVMFQSKEPYDKLWNTALLFSTKSDEWQNGESHRLDFGNNVEFLSARCRIPFIQSLLGKSINQQFSLLQGPSKI